MTQTLITLGSLIAYLTLGSVIAAVWYKHDRRADIASIVSLWPIVLSVLLLYKLVRWAMRSTVTRKVAWVLGQVLVLFIWIVTIPFRTTTKIISDKEVTLPKATAKENNGLGR